MAKTPPLQLAVAKLLQPYFFKQWLFLAPIIYQSIPLG